MYPMLPCRTWPMGTMVMLRLIAKASEWYGGALSIGEAVGLRVDCEGCQLAGNINREQGLWQGWLMGRATAPRESLVITQSFPGPKAL